MIAYSKCAVKFVYKDHSRELENVNNLKNETVVCYIEVFFKVGLTVFLIDICVFFSVHQINKIVHIIVHRM